jgi:hypothetical protein
MTTTVQIRSISVGRQSRRPSTRRPRTRRQHTTTTHDSNNSTIDDCHHNDFNDCQTHNATNSSDCAITITNDKKTIRQRRPKTTIVDNVFTITKNCNLTSSRLRIDDDCVNNNDYSIYLFQLRLAPTTATATTTITTTNVFLFISTTSSASNSDSDMDICTVALGLTPMLPLGTNSH